MSHFKRNLITTALPYANGPVHIGHLAGVYVPADIYVRYLRAKGEEVVFIGGSDEHGVPITIKAQKEGVTPQDIVDRYHSLIKNRLRNSVFLLIFIPEPVQKRITNCRPLFLRNCMRMESSLKKLLCNITMRRSDNFWRTVISPGNVPIVVMNGLMATSARHAVPA